MKFSRISVSMLLLICIALMPAHTIIVSGTASRAKTGILGFSRPNYHPLSGPVSGPQQTLAILVEFADVKHTRDKAAIDTLVFDQMAKYYAEVSYGQIQVVGRSVGWFTLPEDLQYYGADIGSSSSGSDVRDEQLIADAIQAAQESADFKGFSRIMVVHAGVGQEDSTENSTLIWSRTYWSGLSIHTSNGAVVNAAAIVPEMEADGHSALGVYAHEYGHLLFLPDLYDENIRPDKADHFVGRWSLMGTGLWLGDPKGSSPAELEAWSRIRLGWLTPDFVELATNNLSLQMEALSPLETSTGVRAIKIPVADTEYYLMEFREKTSFDAYLPGSGILITRIDESKDSGGGIVQVIDANPSTASLNDAAYGVEGTYKDPAGRVFIHIMSSDGQTYSILVSNQELSSIAVTTTRIIGFQTINATYSRSAALSAKLVDQFGNALEGLPVKLQYYMDGRWNDFGFVLTDAQGNINFEGPLTMNPGEYLVRFLFAGGKSGEHYLAGADHVARLNLRKISTNIQVQSAEVAEATEPSTVNIRVLDEFGKPVDNLQAFVWLDGQLIRRERITNGVLTHTLYFQLAQVGAHMLKVEVEGSTFYDGSTVTQRFRVVPPAWLYVLLVVCSLLLILTGYIIVQRRHRQE